MDIDPLPAAEAVSTFGATQIVALLLALPALMASGFCSGSEIAYFSLDPEDERLDDTPRGAVVRKLLGLPERLLATLLIANNLVNVTIVVLCNFALGAVFTGMSEVMSFICQTIILTFIILLFGEILPKLYSNSNPLRWALATAPAISAMMKLFKPLSSLLVRSTFIVNRVVTRKTDHISADELQKALEITDVKTDDEKEMLREILRFGNTTASEIMTPRVDITDVDIADDFSEVMKIVVESGYARLPVYGDSQDDIRGILYSRDLLPYVGSAESNIEWQKLIRKPYFVPESRLIDDLLEDFRKMKIHMAVVVDEFGGTQGIVTMEDVLEEIVGDINDEYDEEEKTWRQLPDDTFIFEGKTLLGDFFRVTGLNEEDYEEVTADCETLAGMLLAIKGDFPKEKEPMVYGRCRFLILDIDHHRITSVRVKVMPDIQTA